MDVPHPEIFKAYDIRGIVGKSLTEDIVEQIGRAIGTEALAAGDRAVVVGRDGRLSGPTIAGALMEGICATGCDAVDIGMVPTPLTYFATQALDIGSAVSVTGSHNPPDYNGLKVMIGTTHWRPNAYRTCANGLRIGSFRLVPDSGTQKTLFPNICVG